MSLHIDQNIPMMNRKVSSFCANNIAEKENVPLSTYVNDLSQEHRDILQNNILDLITPSTIEEYFIKHVESLDDIIKSQDDRKNQMADIDEIFSNENRVLGEKNFKVKPKINPTICRVKNCMQNVQSLKKQQEDNSLYKRKVNNSVLNNEIIINKTFKSDDISLDNILDSQSVTEEDIALLDANLNKPNEEEQSKSISNIIQESIPGEIIGSINLGENDDIKSIMINEDNTLYNDYSNKVINATPTNMLYESSCNDIAKNGQQGSLSNGYYPQQYNVTNVTQDNIDFEFMLNNADYTQNNNYFESFFNNNVTQNNIDFETFYDNTENISQQYEINNGLTFNDEVSYATLQETPQNSRGNDFGILDEVVYNPTANDGNGQIDNGAQNQQVTCSADDENLVLYGIDEYYDHRTPENAEDDSSNMEEGPMSENFPVKFFLEETPDEFMKLRKLLGNRLPLVCYPQATKMISPVKKNMVSKRKPYGVIQEAKPVIKRNSRRKQIVKVIDGIDNEIRSSVDIQEKSTNKNSLKYDLNDLYPDVEPMELDTIFKRKKKSLTIPSVTRNRKNTQKVDPLETAEITPQINEYRRKKDDRAFYPSFNEQIMVIPISNFISYKIENSSDYETEEIDNTKEFGTLLNSGKCGFCCKIFKSPRMISIHKKSCLAKMSNITQTEELL